MRSDCKAKEDLRARATAQSVVEFGDDTWSESRAKLEERAFLLRNRHGEERFTCLSKLCALGHESESVEVHVGAAKHRDQGLVAPTALIHVYFESGDRESARRLDDAARVLEH